MSRHVVSELSNQISLVDFNHMMSTPAFDQNQSSNDSSIVPSIMIETRTNSFVMKNVSQLVGTWRRMPALLSKYQVALG